MTEKINKDPLPVQETLVINHELVAHLLGAAALAESNQPDLGDLTEAQRSPVRRGTSEGSEGVPGLREPNLGGTGSPSAMRPNRYW